MADLPELENYPDGIHQLETQEFVLGGLNGPANAQAIQLANRTKWLKARAMASLRVEDIVPVSGAHAVVADDIGKVLSVVDPATGSFTLPALAGFPKHCPITIVVNNGSSALVPLDANGAEVIEEFLNSGDGVTHYKLEAGGRYVIVATVTSWVIVFKTLQVPDVYGDEAGDVRFSARPVYNRPGYLLCDGSAISRVTYAALFLAIGTVYGGGDGSTTFNLPEHRDGFLRVHNGGRGLDPGRVFGTWQNDALKDHTHEFDQTQTQGAGTQKGYVRGLFQEVAVDHTEGVDGVDGGSAETRPVNMGINTFIKF